MAFSSLWRCDAPYCPVTDELLPGGEPSVQWFIVRQYTPDDDDDIPASYTFCSRACLAVWAESEMLVEQK